MKLFDIKEPITSSQIKKEELYNKDDNIIDNENSAKIAFGIDLGTTNSLIAIKENEKIKILDDPFNNKRLIPSIIEYYDNSDIHKNNKENTYKISSIKRLMGKTLHDVNHSSSYKLNELSKWVITEKNNEIFIKIKEGLLKTPVEISCDILLILKDIVKTHGYINDISDEINAVITVPAHFDEPARVATKSAAAMANINVIRIINEPTAAAIAYGLDNINNNNMKKGIYAVYDLGGGTFDVSVIKMHQGVLQVLSTSGDNNLGGDDFDKLIAEYLIKKYNISIEDISYNRISDEAKAIKECLSFYEEWAGAFLNKNDIVFNRNEFNSLIEDLINHSIYLLKDAIQGADAEDFLKISDINAVILVGGATRIPLIRSKILNLILDDNKILNHINPDEVVAMGAAISANNLITSSSSSLLLDVTPLSLGIEIMGDLVEKIIPRNTTIPTEQRQIYTTSKDNQSAIKIHILQGEYEEASKCRSIGKFELTGIPHMKAGVPRIEVSFKIDADGLLIVKAIENNTKITKEIEVKPSYDLSQEEIKNQLNN